MSERQKCLKIVCARTLLVRMTGKTLRLVGEIVDFEYIVTSSNLEALILELNLIKKHDPKYNIQLKDDKTYPFIKITAEKQPRLLITRM